MKPKLNPRRVSIRYSCLRPPGVVGIRSVRSTPGWISVGDTLRAIDGGDSDGHGRTPDGHEGGEGDRRAGPEGEVGGAHVSHHSGEVGVRIDGRVLGLGEGAERDGHGVRRRGYEGDASAQSQTVGYEEWISGVHGSSETWHTVSVLINT